MTVRNSLMATDCEMVRIKQAFDGLATVQDTMDAEYAWLDSECLTETVGNVLVITKIDYNFKADEPTDETI